MEKYILNPADSATVLQKNGAIRVWVSAPSIVAPGEDFTIRISLLRIDGYPANEYEGELRVEENTGIENLPERLVFSKENEGVLLIGNCFIREEGVYDFKISPIKGFFPIGQSHPVLVKKGFPYRLYWGDLHVHSNLAKCETQYLSKSPDFGYWYARDILGHDFCSITDHAAYLNNTGWEQLKDSASRWNDPGSFVSFLGFEGDYDGEDGGHFNIYFPSGEGEYRSFRRDSGGSLDSMFSFAREHNALAICHHTARTLYGRNFEKSRFGGRDIEPVMEVYSQRGSSEEYVSTRPMTVQGPNPDRAHYYRYAVSQGYRMGVVGGSGSHCTTPGGLVPMIDPECGAKKVIKYTGGITGIYAADLSRDSLLEAIRARRCCATMSDKILIWTEAQGEPMGSEITANTAEIDVMILFSGPLSEVLIIKNGEVAGRFGVLGEKEGFDSKRKIFRYTWKDKDFSRESSYYVSARQVDGYMAWSSPIWIRPK